MPPGPPQPDRRRPLTLSLLPLSIGQRQGEPERGTAFLAFCHPHFPLLRFYDFLDNRKPQPSSLPGALIFCIQMRKPTEKIIALPRGNPTALIDDLHPNLFILDFMLDLD